MFLMSLLCLPSSSGISSDTIPPPVEISEHKERGYCIDQEGSSTAMASPSESRNLASEETEVTSDHRHQQQQLPADSVAAARELDLEFPLVRESSIYSLTLDEIQNAVCEPGKTFGSMNMDEFLTNIWNAEEGQAAGAGAPPTAGNLTNCGSAAAPAGGELRRQGSLTLPSPLCRKTVDEVWAEIHRGAALRSQQQAPPQQQQQQQHHHHEDGGGSGGNPARRQPTLGEMTLEDFLIKAGVVREGYAGNGPPAAPPAPVTPPQYGMAGFQIPTTEMPSQFGHMVGYVEHQQGMRHAPMQNGVGYPVGKGYMANGYGINGSPTSPGGSSEGMGGGGGHGDGAAMAAYGVPEGGAEGRGMSSRKRGPENGTTVDKVVERRQRRMIKNRESAARSRARKQAYTVELEAELNQLKEENARLKEEQKKETQLRKKLLLDAMSEQARANMRKPVLTLRRCNSASW